MRPALSRGALNAPPAELRKESQGSNSINAPIAEPMEIVDGAGPPTDESNSEEEESAGLNNTNLSDKRRAQNIRFSAWLNQRTAKATKAEVQAAVENANDETLSIRALVSKQDFSKIITDPREYQLELFEKAKTQNTIAVLDTGSGKTMIAILLLRHIIDKELQDRAINKSPRISFFLVDCVTLVFQQADVLETNLDQKIERFCGEMGCDLWSGEAWKNIFSENMVIVCTAEILYQCLMHSFITLDQVNLLIFDEAHHAKKSHAYARIIKDFYTAQNSANRPRIFGMTASPVDARDDEVKAAKELEAMLHCQIATASDMSLLRNIVARPTERILSYERLPGPYDTHLCSMLRSKFGDVKVLSRILAFTKEAASQLGEWCADLVWRTAMEDEEASKIERKMERAFNADQGCRPMAILDAQIGRLKQAKKTVEKWDYPGPTYDGNSLSLKVKALHQYLADIFERPTEAKCIIFVKKRYTARVLTELFTRLGPPYLRPGLLIGTRYGDAGDVKISFKQQILTLNKFRKGETNCLVATSIAEEGLDIPLCNIVIRFDLYETLIQYIQSRGRARHSNSKYLHMIEDGNQAQIYALSEMRRGEEKMRAFCEALPADRLLQGNGNEKDFETVIARERGHRKYIDPESGATLTYGSSLVVLAHFVGCLPRHDDIAQQPTFHTSVKDGKFVCEVILPENSPVHCAVGRPAPRKAVARRSAAFEACCLLRQQGHLDANLIPTYHKLLPLMRNARLALNTNKSSAYVMRTKPDLWERSRGSSPDKLYITVLHLEKPENLGRPCQPLAMLTRTPMPDFPSFLLHLQSDKVSNMLCTSLKRSFDVNGTSLSELNEFTLRIYKDIFNKTFEVNEPAMSYWLAPVYNDWTHRSQQHTPEELIDWSIVHTVYERPEINWTIDTPVEKLINRYLIDRWNGGRRFISIAIEPDMRPLDPVPANVPRHKYMTNIMDYSVSLFAKSKARATWRDDQPVIRAEKVLHRLNWLDDFTEKEKVVTTRCWLCPEPLKISTLPTTVVSMAYIFPGIITRLESYLITLEAFSLFGLDVRPELALEAFTKDSDNTDEHRAAQIHVQRGMGKNYERLEFIGDCFLKMATSISLFSSNPEDNEFEYHVRRMVMTSNGHLLKTALETKLYEHIRSISFSRRNWYPQGLKLLEGKGHTKTGLEIAHHHLGGKTIADVCEAMIGAALLSYRDSGDMDIAVKAVTALVVSPDHNVSKWADYYPSYIKPRYQLAEATASQLDLAKQIGERLGYHFKYPRLLRSAFIHPSYPSATEKIPCYQRLEWLGDSLLDMVSINFLFYRHPDKDPQWLTEHKMAMVTNKFLAALSVKLGFHKHLRFNGAHVEHQNREYVAEILEAENEAHGARNYWMMTKDPPKNLSDIVESYIGAVFVDSEFDFTEVERFFDRHMRWFFEDMSIYDTFANNHPTTYLHKLLTLSLGCTNYRIMAHEIKAIAPGSAPTAVAVLMIHDEIVAEGQASSTKNAKVKASSNALELLRGLAPFEYRIKYGCDCTGEEKDWVGKDGGGVQMVGSAI